MYPMLFVKKERQHVSQTTILSAPPPLILGFHPSKRHAALIASRDQGSVVLTFTLVLLVLKRFLWQHPAFFMSGRSNPLWFALIFKSGRNIC